MSVGWIASRLYGADRLWDGSTGIRCHSAGFLMLKPFLFKLWSLMILSIKATTKNSRALKDSTIWKQVNFLSWKIAAVSGSFRNNVDRARTRILARPRVAVIPPAEHSTIRLVLTYHPTNQLIINIISRNFHLLRDDPNTAAIFQPLHMYAYRCDQNLRGYLVRTTITNSTTADGDSGTFPFGRSRCNTCLHTNTSSFIDTPGGRITFTSK